MQPGAIYVKLLPPTEADDKQNCIRKEMCDFLLGKPGAETTQPAHANTQQSYQRYNLF